MGWGRALRRRARAAVPPLLFLSLVAYFAWNAARGDHGLRAYAAREQQLVVVKGELAQAQAERDTWQAKVSGLDDRRLNPDMLDERARSQLNLASPSDVVLSYGASHKLF